MNTFHEVFKDFKTSLSPKKMFFRYISLFWWIRISLIALVTLIIGIYGIIINNDWLLIPYALLLILMFVLILKKGDEIKQKKYGSPEEYKDKHYKLLIEILEKHSLYLENNKDLTRFHIQTLIDIAKQLTSSKKLSTTILGLFVSLLSLIPSLLGLLVIDFSILSYPEVLGMILTLVIMLLGLFLMTWPLIQIVLDRNHNKIIDFKNMLYDILLKRI